MGEIGEIDRSYPFDEPRRDLRAGSGYFSSRWLSDGSSVAVTFDVGGGRGETANKYIGVLYKAYTPELMILLCRFHRMGLHIFDMEIGEWLNSPAREKTSTE